VMVLNHPEAVRKLHVWRTYFDRILRESASIAYELNTPWDSGISSVFSRDDASCCTFCTLIELLSSTADPSRRSAPPPPPWSRRDVPGCCNSHHLVPIEMLRQGSPHSIGSSLSHPGGNDEDITCCLLFT